MLKTNINLTSNDSEHSTPPITCANEGERYTNNQERYIIQDISWKLRKAHTSDMVLITLKFPNSVIHLTFVTHSKRFHLNKYFVNYT
jgi:hypothetical protein